MGGPPKWMVKIMENPIKIDDLGVPVFLETPTYIYIYILSLGILNIRSAGVPTVKHTLE